jgi:hypothetical protein
MSQCNPSIAIIKIKMKKVSGKCSQKVSDEHGGNYVLVQQLCHCLYAIKTIWTLFPNKKVTQLVSMLSICSSRSKNMYCSSGGLYRYILVCNHSELLLGATQALLLGE